MTWYSEWFGEEYLELYAHRDEEEARQQVEFFRRHIGSVQGPILDLACGSGRHLQRLRSDGYEAVGCDLSFILLQTARVEDRDLRLTRADMRALPFLSSAFKALVNFFTSFGYFERQDEDFVAASEMCRVLSRGAPFLFDYLNVTRELQALVPREEKQTEIGRVTIERWFDAPSRTFNKRMTIGDRRFLERVRGYEFDEITALFAAAGLAIHTVHGSFDDAPFTPESPRMIVIGRRR